MNWFVEQDMNVMRWTAQSPHINPIENGWGMLTHRVCEGGSQLTCKKELETSILQAWDELNYAHIERHVRSMTSRCNAVLELKGIKSPY